MLPWGSGYKLLQTGSLEVPKKFRNVPRLKSFLYPQGANFACLCLVILIVASNSFCSSFACSILDSFQLKPFFNLHSTGF